MLKEWHITGLTHKRIGSRSWSSNVWTEDKSFKLLCAICIDFKAPCNELKTSKENCDRHWQEVLEFGLAASKYARDQKHLGLDFHRDDRTSSVRHGYSVEDTSKLVGVYVHGDAVDLDTVDLNDMDKSQQQHIVNVLFALHTFSTTDKAILTSKSTICTARS